MTFCTFYSRDLEPRTGGLPFPRKKQEEAKLVVCVSRGGKKKRAIGRFSDLGPSVLYGLVVVGLARTSELNRSVRRSDGVFPWDRCLENHQR